MFKILLMTFIGYLGLISYLALDNYAKNNPTRNVASVNATHQSSTSSESESEDPNEPKNSDPTHTEGQVRDKDLNLSTSYSENRLLMLQLKSISTVIEDKIREDSNLWSQIQNGIWQNLPVTLLFFILGLVRFRADEKSRKRSSSKFSLKFYKRESVWIPADNKWMVKTHLNLGVYRHKKSFEKKAS